MRTLLPLLALSAIALLALPLQGQVPGEAEHWMETEDPFPVVGWPDGNAAAGQRAFRDLGCTRCHSIPTIPALRHEDDRAGPDLVGTPALRPRLLLVRQIVAPGTDQADGITHMEDFSDLMTVRQLTDLVTFLEGLDPPPGGDDL